MAREIYEREDLLRDATALVPRIAMRIVYEEPEAREEVVAGYRGEALSLYFSGDPVYHFNAAGQLRRAFVDGRIIKAERGRLVALKRCEAAEHTVLDRCELNGPACEQLLGNAATRISQLASSIEAGRVEIIGEAPANGNALDRLRAWLAQGRVMEAAYEARL